MAKRIATRVKQQSGVRPFRVAVGVWREDCGDAGTAVDAAERDRLATAGVGLIVHLLTIG